MKRKLRLLTYMVAILSMVIVIGGCSKQEQKKTDDTLNNKVEDAGDNTEDKDNEEDRALVEDIANGSTVAGQDKADEADEAGEEVEEEVFDQNYVVQELPLLEEGIKSVYDPHGLLTGTCINGFVTKAFSDHIIQNYNSVTLENDMKPDAILNQAKSIAAGDIVVDYQKRTTDLLDWAKENDMKVRGHVLVWYSQTPKWIFYEDFDTKKALVDRDTMLARMESYIKQNFEILESLGYIDMFYAYDIVNEAINDDGSLRDCLWKQIIGDDYIWHAFYYADKYAPEHVKLYYNDYNEQFKTNHVVKMVESLEGVNGISLIDGIGCQAHLYTKDSIDKYIKTLEAFSETGLDVQITEIDVSLGTWQNILQPEDEIIREQGRYYYELVNRIIEGNKAGTTNVSGITFWGVSDGVSWRKDRNPLLLDLEFKPKYAYFGAIQDKAHAGY